MAPFCKKNLQLASHVAHCILTFQEWEIPSPAGEKPPELEGKAEHDMFRTDNEFKQKKRAAVRTFYQDFL